MRVTVSVEPVWLADELCWGVDDCSEWVWWAKECSWLLGRESRSDSSLLSEDAFRGAFRAVLRFFCFGIFEDASVTVWREASCVNVPTKATELKWFTSSKSSKLSSLKNSSSEKERRSRR